MSIFYFDQCQILSNFKLYLSNRIIINSDRLQKDEIETENNSQIRNYIVEILKREASLPMIKSEMNLDLSDAKLTNFIQNSINIIKFEYMEKQKKVVIEFQKRYYLKKQKCIFFKLSNVQHHQK
jgi:hypothetical protein